MIVADRWRLNLNEQTTLLAKIQNKAQIAIILGLYLFIQNCDYNMQGSRHYQLYDTALAHNNEYVRNFVWQSQDMLNRCII